MRLPLIFDIGQGGQIMAASSDHRGVLWIDDADARQCACCDKLFTLLRRKHHCRLCGQVICDACSKTRRVVGLRRQGKDTKQAARDKLKRVCDACEYSMQGEEREIQAAGGTGGTAADASLLLQPSANGNTPELLIRPRSVFLNKKSRPASWLLTNKKSDSFSAPKYHRHRRQASTAVAVEDTSSAVRTAWQLATAQRNRLLVFSRELKDTEVVLKTRLRIQKKSDRISSGGANIKSSALPLPARSAEEKEGKESKEDKEEKVFVSSSCSSMVTPPLEEERFSIMSSEGMSSSNGVLKIGELYKLGEGTFKSWKKRRFEVRANYLSYYLDNELKNTINLTHATIPSGDEGKIYFYNQFLLYP